MPTSSPDALQDGSAEQEDARLLALEQFGMFGTPPEEDFDSIAALAARVLNCPVAVISLIGRDLIFFKAHYGTDLTVLPRNTSICGHVANAAAPLVLTDAAKSERFADNPLVTAPGGIRFYAGTPLVANSGHIVGTLCVFDPAPHDTFSDDDRRTLQDLARLTMHYMEIRRLRRVGEEERRARELSERKFEILLSGVKDYALYMLSPTGIVSSWNCGAEAIKGYGAAEILGQHFSRFYTDADRVRGAPQRALRIAETQGRFEEDAWHVRRDGSLFWANVVIDAIRDSNGELIGFAKISRDITHRRQNEEHLRRLALTDSLTGLPNRYAFLHRLAKIIQREPAALLLLDLDGFKEINDTHGHQAGDALLKAVGLRLQKAVGAGQAGRIGGDEFAAVFPGMANPIAVVGQIKTITDAFRAPFACDGSEVQIGLSIGIAIAPVHGETMDELLANADLALYDVKSQRRTGYSFFQEIFRQTALARRTCEAELRRAVAQGEFELYYQPQLRLADRQIVGVEALLRWNHPERGLILPGAFIHVLERSPLAVPVGEWILREACAFAASVRRAGRVDFKVAVNLFGAQFRSSDLKAIIVGSLEEHELSPEALELELTENIVLQNDDTIYAAIRDLAVMGVRVSFDDYGTGYASLSLLKRFPLASLKIDRSFVRDLCTNSEDAAVVNAVIYLAKSFGLEVVAEGIETEEQERLLRLIGCEFAQGFLFARPMPAADLRTFLNDAADNAVPRPRALG